MKRVVLLAFMFCCCRLTDGVVYNMIGLYQLGNIRHDKHCRVPQMHARKMRCPELLHETMKSALYRLISFLKGASVQAGTPENKHGPQCIASYDVYICIYTLYIHMYLYVAFVIGGWGIYYWEEGIITQVRQPLMFCFTPSLHPATSSQ